MEKYFPFMSVGGDRKYNADNWAEYFALFLCDGVFYSSVDRLRVTASDGMKVKIGKGAAFISGRCYILDADLDVTLDLADGALNRIDRIVIRCDYTERNITAQVKKGAYSASPVARELQRDADAYELAIADVYVGKGVVTITTADITDLRLNCYLLVYLNQNLQFFSKLNKVWDILICCIFRQIILSPYLLCYPFV